jgi:hypothetical protein
MAISQHCKTKPLIRSLQSTTGTEGCVGMEVGISVAAGVGEGVTGVLVGEGTAVGVAVGAIMGAVQAASMISTGHVTITKNMNYGKSSLGECGFTL